MFIKAAFIDEKLKKKKTVILLNIITGKKNYLNVF